MSVCLAVDIGGTKLAVGLVTSDGELLDRRQCPTPQGVDDEALFSTLIDLCEDLLTSASQEPELVGVGCGGPMDCGKGLVSPLNIPAWRDFPLPERLSQHFNLVTFLANDAQALALGEGWRGAAAGKDSFVAMVVSTGIGGGIVLDGHLLHGRLGNAGHIGHLVVNPGGRRCRCGVRGCLEAEASGTAIEEITGRPAREASPDVIERTGELVGRAVASVMTLLDLDLCSVAGSVALGFGQPFFDAAQRSLAMFTGLAYVEGARIVPAGLGELGPLIGAAAAGFSRHNILVVA